jgi:hypothetical protein
MNIFYLHPDPKICAQMHVDKHCVKMILESAQLLSTAHRLLDGTETTILSKNNRNKKVWQLPDSRENILYSATHINHPSAIWARYSKNNYSWLFALFCELLAEYTYRYGKTHKCSSLTMELARIPDNLTKDHWTEPTPAMPDKYKVAGNSVKSYHNYYNGEKRRMFSWKGRNTPDWIEVS